MFLKILFLLLAYLIGSIPFGLILGLVFKKIDIREYGSKNIGTTNTGRVLGKKYAIITYILDMLKGFIFVFLFRFNIIPEKYMVLDPSLYGLIACLGHSFSIYLKFNGGKAVATGGGAIFGYCPYLIIVGLGVFFLILLFTKIVSFGSLVTSVVILLCTIVLWIIGYDPIFTFLPQVKIYLPITALIIVLLIFIRHKDNIIRLKNKNENKVTWLNKKESN